MNDGENDFKCENCSSTEYIFKVTILSLCREHSYNEIYCNEYIANVIREFLEDIDLIEKV